MQDYSWYNKDKPPTFTMDNVNKFAGVLGGIVINALWSALETEKGKKEFAGAVVDKSCM